MAAAAAAEPSPASVYASARTTNNGSSGEVVIFNRPVIRFTAPIQATPEGAQPRAEVTSALHANIQDVFNERGVQIMSPHYLGDPKDAKLVPPAGWYPPPAAPPG